jgi:CRISPR-associated protein Cas2
MEVLVAYDVATDTAAGRRRLRRVAQICLDYGQRVQKSVFECSINEMQYETLRDRLLKCIDTEEDNLRIYRLIGAREQHVEAYGVSRYVDFSDSLVV